MLSHFEILSGLEGTILEFEVYLNCYKYLYFLAEACLVLEMKDLHLQIV